MERHITDWDMTYYGGGWSMLQRWADRRGRIVWRVGWGRNRTDEELRAVLADEAAARWQRKAAAVMLASRWVVRSGQYDPAQVGVYGSRRTVADSVGQWVRFAWVNTGRRPVVGLEVGRVVGRVALMDGGWAWCYGIVDGMVLGPSSESTYRVEVVRSPFEAERK